MIIFAQYQGTPDQVLSALMALVLVFFLFVEL